MHAAMLTSSFIMLDRISLKTEQQLWQQGIHDWEAFLQQERIPGIGSRRKQFYNQQLRLFQRALGSSDLAFLTTNFPRAEQWRLFPLLQEILYLDIETTEQYGDITVLGAADEEEYYSFVKGCNLEKSLVEELFARYQLVVTFNGSSFDLPIIQRYFGGILPAAMLHLDVRHLLARLNLHGGLKRIEQQLGITRTGSVADIRGEHVGLLWYQYLVTREEEFIQLLLDYNRADCENLIPLTQYAVTNLWQQLRQQSL